MPLPKKKVVTCEKVTTSEEFDKDTKILDDIKNSVVPIRRIWITLRGSLKYQQVGLILIMRKIYEIFLQLNWTSIKNL